jgi:hypothetical protein
MYLKIVCKNKDVNSIRHESIYKCNSYSLDDFGDHFEIGLDSGEQFHINKKEKDGVPILIDYEYYNYYVLDEKGNTIEAHKWSD